MTTLPNPTVTMAVAATGLSLLCGAAPAFGEPERTATCETIAHIVETLPEDEWAATILVMTGQKIVGLSVSDPITATIFCPHAPQIVCMEISNPDKVVGDVVSLSGRIARADDRYVLLDPCFSMRISK